jgi:Mor family transcriptional regulator
MSKIKLTPAKVNNIRNLYRSGNWTHEELSKRYNCSRGHITKVINNKRWNENDYPTL